MNCNLSYKSQIVKLFVSNWLVVIDLSWSTFLKYFLCSTFFEIGPVRSLIRICDVAILQIHMDLS